VDALDTAKQSLTYLGVHQIEFFPCLTTETDLAFETSSFFKKSDDGQNSKKEF
jgi:hypothetical protein